MDRPGRAVLELAAADCMGAMRHVAALLSRRAYPLLALACLAEGDGAGRLLVAVADDGRLERLLAQAAGLPEVLSARLGDPAAPEMAPLLGEAVSA